MTVITLFFKLFHDCELLLTLWVYKNVIYFKITVGYKTICKKYLRLYRSGKGLARLPQSIRGKLYKKYISSFSWLRDGFFISFPGGTRARIAGDVWKNLTGIKLPFIGLRGGLIAVIQSVLCRTRIIRISRLYVKMFIRWIFVLLWYSRFAQGNKILLCFRFLIFLYTCRLMLRA